MNRLLMMFVLLLCSSRVLGWGPLAHWLIAKDTLGKEAAPFANLPDAWESQEEIITYFTTGLHFRWSHGVIDCGRLYQLAGTVAVPRTPEYADDGRRPEEAMAALLKDRLDLSGGRWGDRKTLELVRDGFLAHNLADRRVHWGVFLGGREKASDNVTLTSWDQLEEWAVHHGLKEVWAEFLLLEKLYPDERIVFQADGSVAPPKECPSLGIPSLDSRCADMARLLRLSQQVFRKGRAQHCRRDGEVTFEFEVQSRVEIETLLRQFNAELLGHFSKRCWGIWEGMNVNFVSDYVTVNEHGEPVTCVFDTPGTLQEEYRQLKLVEKKLLSESDMLDYRGERGFVWLSELVIDTFDSCTSKDKEQK